MDAANCDTLFLILQYNIYHKGKIRLNHILECLI